MLLIFAEVQRICVCDHKALVKLVVFLGSPSKVVPHFPPGVLLVFFLGGLEGSSERGEAFDANQPLESCDCDLIYAVHSSSHIPICMCGHPLEVTQKWKRERAENIKSLSDSLCESGLLPF